MPDTEPVETTTEPEPVELSVCVDCYIWITNVETDPNWTEAEQETFLAAFYEGTEGFEHLAVGDDNYGFTVHSRCDTCTSYLGGTRFQAFGFLFVNA